MDVPILHNSKRGERCYQVKVYEQLLEAQELLVIMRLVAAGIDHRRHHLCLHICGQRPTERAVLLRARIQSEITRLAAAVPTT
jgi:hypothetical protein